MENILKSAVKNPNMDTTPTGGSYCREYAKHRLRAEFQSI